MIRKMLAKISVKDLLLRTIIGINAEERTKKQDVLISFDLRYDATEAVKSDQITQSCNYKQLTKNIIKLVEASSYNLLERLTAEIVKIIMKSELVHWCQVTVRKPHALRFAEDVSVTMEFEQ